MTKGTFWLERKPDGGVEIGIEDYDVEAFGGCDYEWIYTLDRVNKEKLIATLRKSQSYAPEATANAPDPASKSASRTLEDLIEAEFGIHLDKKSMQMWFDENGITYDFCSWVHNNMSHTYNLVRRGK